MEAFANPQNLFFGVANGKTNRRSVRSQGIRRRRNVQPCLHVLRKVKNAKSGAVWRRSKRATKLRMKATKLRNVLVQAEVGKCPESRRHPCVESRANFFQVRKPGTCLPGNLFQ